MEEDNAKTGINTEGSTPLTDERMESFAQEYAADCNGGRAARSVGVKDVSAYEMASRWLRRVEIKARIEHLLAERRNRVSFEADDLLFRLIDMVNADPAEIIDKETGSFMPIHEWPLIMRQMLEGMDVEELYEGRGDERANVGRVLKPRFPNKAKLIEMLGNHRAIQAFRENLNVTVDESDVDRVLAARKRARAREE